MFHFLGLFIFFCKFLFSTILFVSEDLSLLFLVISVCWISSLSYYLPRKVFISHSFLKHIFLKNGILGWKSFFFMSSFIRCHFIHLFLIFVSVSKVLSQSNWIVECECVCVCVTSTYILGQHLDVVNFTMEGNGWLI